MENKTSKPIIPTRNFSFLGHFQNPIRERLDPNQLITILNPSSAYRFLPDIHYLVQNFKISRFIDLSQPTNHREMECLTQRNRDTLQTGFKLKHKKAKRCWVLSTELVLIPVWMKQS